jgi:hypothetical protein
LNPSRLAPILAPSAPGVNPELTVPARLSANAVNYSGFDSGLYRILDAKWHFSQENATLHHLQMTTFESKPL